MCNFSNINITHWKHRLCVCTFVCWLVEDMYHITSETAWDTKHSHRKSGQSLLCLLLPSPSDGDKTCVINQLLKYIFHCSRVLVLLMLNHWHACLDVFSTKHNNLDAHYNFSSLNLNYAAVLWIGSAVLLLVEPLSNFHGSLHHHCMNVCECGNYSTCYKCKAVYCLPLPTTSNNHSNNNTNNNC